MKPQVFEIMEQGPYFLRLKYEVDEPLDGAPVFRVLLEGDARTKTLYEGKEEVEAIRVWSNEKAHYTAQLEAAKK